MKKKHLISLTFDLGELTDHVGPDPGYTHSLQVLDQHLKEHPEHQVRRRIELAWEKISKRISPYKLRRL